MEYTSKGGQKGKIVGVTANRERRVEIWSCALTHRRLLHIVEENKMLLLKKSGQWKEIWKKRNCTKRVRWDFFYCKAGCTSVLCFMKSFLESGLFSFDPYSSSFLYLPKDLSASIHGKQWLHTLSSLKFSTFPYFTEAKTASSAWLFAMLNHSEFNHCFPSFFLFLTCLHLTCLSKTKWK